MEENASLNAQQLAEMTRFGIERKAQMEAEAADARLAADQRAAEQQRERVAKYVQEKLGPAMMSLNRHMLQAVDRGEGSLTQVWWVKEAEVVNDWDWRTRHIKRIDEDKVHEDTLCVCALKDAVSTDLELRGFSVTDAKEQPRQTVMHGSGSDSYDIDYVLERPYGVKVSWLDETPAEPLKA